MLFLHSLIIIPLFPHFLDCWFIIYKWKLMLKLSSVSFGVVLLSSVLSFDSGSTTGVPNSTEVGWELHVLHHYQGGVIAVRLKRWNRMTKSRKKGEGKDDGDQSSEHLQPGNYCAICHELHFSDSHSWVNVPFLHGVLYKFCFLFNLLTCHL
jgi:hypothetical protein